MKTKTKFKKRYVLAEGYPWVHGVDKNFYSLLSVASSNRGFSPVKIEFPEELWSHELPKYRLILERVDDES